MPFIFHANIMVLLVNICLVASGHTAAATKAAVKLTFPALLNNIYTGYIFL